MEDVLAVYLRPRKADFPLICFDEAAKQLIANTHEPIKMKPGRPARTDYEYERNGTANLFMFFAPLEGWRHVKVTDRRTAVDYAHALKDLADKHLPKAKKIILVQDNLNTHKPASLYEAFPPAEARRLVERFEWHYSPKHGSWLNMAKSELGVLSNAMSRPPHSRSEKLVQRNRGLAKRSKPTSCQSRLAVHHSGCPY